MSEAFRTEKDAMGEVRVPADRLWGAQTQRSIGNFPIGVPRFRWDRPVIRAFGIVKLAAARANAKLGVLAADKAQLIERAAIALGKACKHAGEEGVLDQGIGSQGIAGHQHGQGQQFDRQTEAG